MRTDKCNAYIIDKVQIEVKAIGGRHQASGGRKNIHFP